jgi:ribonuclease HI|uniref:RNase H type-1 domain-containing protein n=1 Tax=Populus trichocarpa TaxID=3694 RepID=A0A3N7FMF0_POPTR
MECDGSSKGKLEPIRIGGVLRNHYGVVSQWILKSRNSNEAELLVVVKAIELSSSMDDFIGKKFLMESDSASVVNWMNKPSSTPWKSHDLFIKAS